MTTTYCPMCGKTVILDEDNACPSCSHRFVRDAQSPSSEQSGNASEGTTRKPPTLITGTPFSLQAARISALIPLVLLLLGGINQTLSSLSDSAGILAMVAFALFFVTLALLFTVAMFVGLALGVVGLAGGIVRRAWGTILLALVGLAVTGTMLVAFIQGFMNAFR